MEPVTDNKTEQQLQIEQINHRRRRIQRLKRFLTFALCVLLLFPNVTCVYLLVQNFHMNKKIDAIYQMISEDSEQTYLDEKSFSNDSAEEIIFS